LLQAFYFETLAFAGIVGSETVSSYPLDAALLLFVFGLCAFPRWEVGLGLREDLTPRLSLLDGLRFG
jgi:hypothetical protein